MAKQRHLTNAPIIEALIDIHVAPQPGLTFDLLKESITAADSGYYEKGPIATVQFDLKPTSDGQQPETTARSAQIGLRMHSHDEKFVAQCRPSGFTLSRLHPYDDWENLVEESKRLWAIYSERLLPARVIRIATRFINNLQLPMQTGDSYQTYLNKLVGVLDRARDKRFWSVRVSRDIRLIVHRTDASLMLCYVAHHDDAYQWAERRRLETHPKTGAAQLVEIRERIEEISVPTYIEAEYPVPSKPALFSGMAEDVLLGYGVPVGWLDEVRKADEDSLLELADHLPVEAAEALLELATGGQPVIARPQPAGEDPFTHPDAQRRFRVMADVEELARALDYPWDKWTVFLHPAQRQIVEKDFAGPARVSGSAGTGKTIVALHRAVFLARSNPDARVLLTTFSESLANFRVGGTCTGRRRPGWRGTQPHFSGRIRRCLC
jgi:uncharacterized protein (TIGR04255 family)